MERISTRDTRALAEDVEALVKYLEINPNQAEVIKIELQNAVNKYDYLGSKLAGIYTTTINWAIYPKLQARPLGNKGYWAKRIPQNEIRVNNFELKINSNNESFYVWNPEKSRYVQFENIKSEALQDGKCVLQPNKSIYRVYDKPEFLRQKILEEATDQVQAAQSNGLKVEWLVSDEIAVEQLTRYFQENNISILIKYLPE